MKRLRIPCTTGVDKRKASAFSDKKIARELDANLKKMKTGAAFSSLFSDSKGVNEGTMSANDLFTRSNGAVGNRM